MTDLSRPVLLTGASGTLGRLLASRLADLGWRLRLTDRAPFPDPVPPGCSFHGLDLDDRAALAEVAEGCGLILHYGGVSTEQSFDAILGPNLRGAYHVYELARRLEARVVYASSNHAFGLYERAVRLDHDCLYRPDGFYGLSKAYGELLARMYWEKHAVETVAVRIGSVLPAAPDARMLATWMSHDDFVRLMQCCADTPEVGFSIVWGVSHNSRSFYGRDDRDRLGWAPRDSSDGQTDAVAGVVTGDPVAERYQGGRFVSKDFTRTDFVPRVMFPGPAPK